MKINVGSGHTPLAGHLNIDIEPPADQVGDFMEMAFTDIDHVEMSHVLEHISWRRTQDALHIVSSWLRSGGTLHVEVPDMTVLLSLGTNFVGWDLGIYGAQINDGEYHRAGFSVEMLVNKVAAAGFRIDSVRTFRSTHPERKGYPCIELHATKP